MGEMKPVGPKGMETFKSILDAAKSAINTSLLVNGGAAASTLAFCGAVASKAEVRVSGYTVLGMSAFAAGVLCASIASGFFYKAQWHDYYLQTNAPNASRCWETFWRQGANFLIAFSYATFVTGATLTGLGIYVMGPLVGAGIAH